MAIKRGGIKSLEIGYFNRKIQGRKDMIKNGVAYYR